jgi:hypothetical protein
MPDPHRPVYCRECLPNHGKPKKTATNAVFILLILCLFEN